MLILFALLVINFGISCWNAYVAGRAWSYVSGWMTLVLWSALVLSACGFLEVTAILLGFLAAAMHWIDARALHALTSLTYLLIIVPVLGAGLVVTIHSWIKAYKRRDFSSIATAGWNTFAQSYNTYDAANGGMSSAFGDVSRFFKSDDDDDAALQAVVLLILFVAAVLSGGLTWVFFRMGRQSAVVGAAP